MARPLIQMALDSLEFHSVEDRVNTNTYIIGGNYYQLEPMPQIKNIASKKMPWEHLNKSAYKGGKNG